MMETLFIVCIAASTQDANATRAAAEAFSKQNRIDEALDNYQRRLVSESTRRRLTPLATFARVALERRVSFEWSY